jgi:hypothetical protein
LIGSNSSISVSGNIYARGGRGGSFPIGYGYNDAGGGGSGGTIRLACLHFSQTAGLLNARGGGPPPAYSAGFGGDGTIRVESYNPPGTINAQPLASIGGPTDFLPTNLSTLTLLSWWNPSTNQWVPINQDPTAYITSTGAADVQLPSTGTHIVRIQGHGIPIGAQLHVRSTYSLGQADVDSTHHMGEVSGSTLDMSWTDVTINFGLGVSTVQVRTTL